MATTAPPRCGGPGRSVDVAPHHGGRGSAPAVHVGGTDDRGLLAGGEALDPPEQLDRRHDQKRAQGEQLDLTDTTDRAPRPRERHQVDEGPSQPDRRGRPEEGRQRPCAQDAEEVVRPGWHGQEPSGRPQPKQEQGHPGPPQGLGLGDQSDVPSCAGVGRSNEDPHAQEAEDARPHPAGGDGANPGVRQRKAEQPTRGERHQAQQLVTRGAGGSPDAERGCQEAGEGHGESPQRPAVEEPTQCRAQQHEPEAGRDEGLRDRPAGAAAPPSA